MEEFNNKTYFTLKEAAKLFGYSSDYLGFLVRKKKIKGKRTYNTRWQITKKELLTYCKERKRKIKKPHLFNKKLTLKQASRFSKYSPDYIGQLLRTEKLKGKRIKTQVSWLVEKQNIENYRDGREERQSNTRKPLSLGFVKIRRKKLVLIGRRLVASTLVFIYFLSGIAPTELLLASIGAFFIEEPKTISLYSQLAEGDWQNPQRAKGPPDISPDKDITSFSESNSAVYQTGPLSLVLKDFDAQEDISNYLFNSAQIKLSFAIGEKEIDISIIEEESGGENTTSSEEQTSFWNKIKQFFNFLLTGIRSIVFKALSIAKAEEEPSDAEAMEGEAIVEENLPVEEEGQSTIGEDEEDILDQDTWLDEIIEEATEESSSVEAMEGEAPPPPEATEGEAEETEEPEEPSSVEATESETEEPVTTTTESIIDQTTITEIEATTTEETPVDQTTTTETEATTTEQEIPPVEETTPATSSDDIIATSSDEVSEEVPSEPESEPEPEPEPDILPNIDAKIIIYWSLDGEDWQILDTISSYPLSNHLNNGYFTYNTPFLTDWQDITNLQIKFEGAVGGQTNIISYLDSVWITAEYEEQVEEETEETPAPDDEGQTPPIEEEQPTDEGGGGGGGDEESPLDQDTWLDEIIEESEEEEQPPEETEDTEETPAPSDEGGDEEPEEQPPEDTEEESPEEETEEPEEVEEEPEGEEQPPEEEKIEEEEEQPEEEEEQPEEELEEETEESTKKKLKLKIKDKDLIFSFQKKDFTSNEEPFFIITTPDLTIEELLNSGKAEKISDEDDEEDDDEEELPELEPMATSTIATSTEEIATTTEEIEEEPVEEELIEEEPEEEQSVEEEQPPEEEPITTTTEPIIEQATTTEATTTEETEEPPIEETPPEKPVEEEPTEEEEEQEPVEEESGEVEEPQESEETEEPEEEEEQEPVEEEEVEEETPAPDDAGQASDQQQETSTTTEPENEELGLLEKIKIFFQNIILTLKQGIQKIVSIIIRIVRLQIPSVKAQAADNLKLIIIKPNGKESSLTPQITTTYINGKEVFEIKLQKPETGLQPGLYKLQIEIETPEAIFISEQEFTWGVLAINVNKSIYTPGEQAYIQIAALNEWGHTLCDAELELRIKNQESGKQVRLSTIHNTIKKSDQCGANNVTNVPDYYTYYQVKEPGTYEMTLKNLDTGYEITDSFKAQNSVPFDVERIGPTRIFPPAQYQMTLKIKANQDFEGQVIEKVPASFEIQIQDTNYKILDTNEAEKLIIWDVNLAQGDELQITYKFDAPDISPYLFLLGPLTFTTQQIVEIGSLQAGSTTTEQIVEIGSLQNAANATGSEAMEAPSDQNGTTTTTDELWRFNLHSLESFTFTFTFQESRKWQLASDAVTLTQHSYIFENDDATNVNSNSNMESANATATDVKKGQRFIARFQLDNTADPSTTTFKLQYDKQDEEWIDVDFGGAPNINSGASSSDWNATIVASTGDAAGYGSSIAIGTDGLPVISHDGLVVGEDRDLKFTKCGNPSCSSGNTTITLHSSDPYFYSSIAIATSGKPVIAYYDLNVGDLKFAQCTTGDCTNISDWTTSTVDSENDVGRQVSIAIATSGRPVISYYDNTSYDLIFARCGNGDCTSKTDWTTTTIETADQVGSRTSIAIGSDGWPVISYYDVTDMELHFAKCTNATCTDPADWSFISLDSAAASYTSIAIGSDGYPVISYNSNSSLKVAKCTTGDCTSVSNWTTSTLDSLSGSVGKGSSIAIGSDGYPVISYQDANSKALKIAKCADSACSASLTTITINQGPTTNFGTYTSLAIGRDGWPVISYYDDDNNDLKVAKMRPLVELQPAWGLSGTSSTPLISNEAGDCTGGTDWTDGQWYEATTTSRAIPLDTDECTELAFVLDTAEATASTTYRLRLVKEDGTPLDIYTELPALKIVKESENTLRYSKEAIKTSASSCDVSDWNCTTTDSTDIVGEYTSIAIGTDGNPVISYFDNTLDSLNVAKCGNPSCTSGNTITSVDLTGGSATFMMSVAIGTDGNPVISYLKSANSSLNVAKCGNPSCTSGNTITTIELPGAGSSGMYSSITIGTNGKPLIAYYRYFSVGDTELRFVKCGNDSCSSGNTTTTVDSGTKIGLYNSIAIGTDGLPVIAYNDDDSDDLLFAKCTTADCTQSTDWSSTTVDTVGNVGYYNSIAIGTDGYPVIAYQDYSSWNLRFAKCTTIDCTNSTDWATTTVDETGIVGQYNSIAIGTDGNPVISYYDDGNDSLNFAKCTTTDCTQKSDWTTTTVDSTGLTGRWSSVAIGTDGYPVISYYDVSNSSLKIAKQLGLPKTAISYFNNYIKTDRQTKVTRNNWSVAATQGPNSPSTIVNDISYGATAWLDTGNATSSDDIWVSILSLGTETSQYLKPTDFGFSIPANATINGITVEVERSASEAGATYIEDSRVRIVKGGVIGSIDKAAVGKWPIIDTYKTYGGSSDLWGEEWTGSDINSSDFGMVIAADFINSLAALIDHIRITVDYTDNGVAYIESSPAIEDGLQYKFDKAGYSAAQTSGDSSFSNVTSTGGTSTSTPIFVFTDKFSDNTQPIYTKWQGQSTLAASDKNIVLQIFRFGNSLSATGWVTTTEETSCTANSDCLILGSTTTDLTDFYYPEYKFNDSTGTTSPDYWVFWRVFQEEATGALSPPTLKTDFWVSQNEALGIHQRAYVFENDDGSTVNSNSDMSATNTTTTDLKKGQRFVARFQLDNDGASATNTYKLQYDKQDDQWIDIDYGGAPNINSGASSSDWNATTVDSTGNVGSYTSIAIGTDGNPVISYQAGSDLNVLKCGNPSCTSGNITTTVTAQGSVGSYTSIAIGTDGNPVISYYDNTNSFLMVAKCGNPSCTSGNSTTSIDSNIDFLIYSTSLAIGTDGYPVISYSVCNDFNGLCNEREFRFGRCTSGDCTDKSNWSTTTLDTKGGQTYFDYTSIAVGTDGYPVIAYDGLDYLRFAKCNTGDCTQSGNWTLSIIDLVGNGHYTSIAIGTDGNPVISYQAGGDLNVLKCGNPSCSSENTTSTIDSTTGIVGYYTSIAIGTDGLPVISYQDYTNKSLKFAKCRDAYCSSVSTTAPFSNITMTIDDSGATQWFGAYTSMAIGWDGWPVISYFDDDNDDLKVAKMRPLVEIQPAWGLSGSSGDALNATQAGSCLAGTSWTNGKWFEATTTGTIGLGANECTELAFVLDTVEATASTTYRLRLVKEDGTALASYVEYPALKIVKETENTLRYSKEAINTSASSCDVSDWDCSTIDAGTVNNYSSIAIGTDGNPVIAYYANLSDLNVIKCGNYSCTSGNTISTVDSGGDVGRYPSIAIGTDGYPVIAYYDNDNTDFKVAKCGNPSCSSGNITTTVHASSTDNIGENNSIAIGTDGYPVISYTDNTTDYVYVLKCGNYSCTSGNTTSTLVDYGGTQSSIAIGTDGYPVIAYYDGSTADKDLKFAKCNDDACSGGDEAITIVDEIGDVGWDPSITIGTDGYPVLSYFDNDNNILNVAKCNNATCTQKSDWSTTTVDSTGSVGRYSSIAIGIDGNPVIAYYNSGNTALNFAKCGNFSCSSGNTTTTIDSVSNVARISIAIGTGGHPIVSYIDGSPNNDLKIAKQLGLPKTAISYFNRYIKTDAQIKISRNMWSGSIPGGPNNPQSAVSDDTVGTMPWGNPTNVFTSNSSWATALLGKGVISEYLKATDFGFSIPNGVTINGIIVEVERYIGAPISDEEVKDKYLRIVKGGSIGSTERADTSTVWPSDFDSYASYGTPTDLWGETWTVSDINSSDFGMAISAVGTKPTGGNSTAQIDHIRITVYYKTPALYLEASPAIEDGLQYKFDKADYTASQTSGDSSFSNVTSTGGTSTSTPMFVFTNKHSTNINPLYAKWQGQSTLGAGSKNIVLQLFRFGNSSNTTGWVTTTVNSTCTANNDCSIEYSTTTDLTDFYYPEYKFNDSTSTTSPDYWTFWRVYQKEVTGAEIPPTLKTDSWQLDTEFTLTQRAYVFENDDGNTVNENSDMSATNTTTTDLKKGQRFIARFQIDNTTLVSATTTFKLQYDKQDSQWIDIDYGGAPNINSGASSSDWNAVTVHASTTADVGRFSSIAIGTDGNPVIAHWDSTNGKVYVVRCGNLSCTSGNTINDLGVTNITGLFFNPSIAIGTDGNPVVTNTFYDDGLPPEYQLLLTKCNNPSCSSKSSNIIDTDETLRFWQTSIAIGTDGNPVIAYGEGNTPDLWFAKCTNPSCSGKSTVELDTTGSNSYTSIAIGTDGKPVISYYKGVSTRNLLFAKCTTGDCTQNSHWTITDIDTTGDVGEYTSLAIGTDGLPVISYFDDTNNNLNFAKCTTTDCTNSTDWSTTTLDTVDDVGYYTSIAIGTDGLPVISYQDNTNKSLKIAKCKDTSCSGATSSQVLITINQGALVDFGRDSSITIGIDGWPVVSYFATSSNSSRLKVAKMRPLVELQPSWGLSGDSGDALNATQAGSCVTGTSWTNGKWFEATTTGTIGLGANECTELAFVLDTVEATASTTYRLRLVKEDGTLLDSYSEYPALKIVKETNNTLRYSKEAIKTSASSCGGTTEYECVEITYDSDIVGLTSSLAIGTDGYPVIAHRRDASSDTLMITKCTSVDCSSISTTTEVSYDSENVGWYPSLAIGTDGFPVIAHQNLGSNPDTLLITKCASADCSSISTTTEVSYDSEHVGSDPSLAIGTDGYPIIAHRNQGSSPDTLLITKCSSADCSSISTTTEVSYDSEDVGWYPSLAIGTDGLPVIAHQNLGSSPRTLLITKCASADCISISTTTEVFYDNEDVGVFPSLAIGTDGYPIIAHSTSTPQHLLITKCASADCSSISTTTEVSYNNETVGTPSLAIGTDGFPVISHRNWTAGSLMVTKCSSADCTSVVTTTKISYGSDDVGTYSSLAIGTDGYPVIAHYNANATALMVTKALGLPKTAISYFNRYIKTDAQVKLTRSVWDGTEGPNNPSTIVDDGSYGDQAWTDESKATSSDGNYAWSLIMQTNSSHYLKATNFGFSIPDGAIISGITVDVEKAYTPPTWIIDDRARIVKGGVIGSTDRSVAGYWPSTFEYVTYGSFTDLWGETWTASDINSSNFGFALSAENTDTGNSRAPFVDHIRITVSYTYQPFYLESSPAIEDGLQYKFDKAGYSAAQTPGDSSFTNVTSTGGTSTSTPVFVFTDKHSTNTNGLYAKWQGQSTLGASDKNIVLQLYRFGNSSNTTGWVTTTVNTTCTANTDCTLEYSTTTDLEDFFYPEYKFNDSTGTTSPDYWTFWRVFQEEVTGSLSPPTLKTDFWQTESESTLTQRAYIFENDDGNTVNENSDMSAANTTTTDVRKGQRFVARFQIDNTGISATNTFKLQYDKQDSQWIDIDYGGAPNINSGASSSDWNAVTVDSGGSVGYYTSIAIGNDGNPVVSYYDATNNNLNFVKCGNPSCTSGNVTTTVDSLKVYSGYPSIAIGTDGYPVISYTMCISAGIGCDDFDLRFAKCTTGDCTQKSYWSTTTVDSEGSVGADTSIAIGTDGYPVISYSDATLGNLNFAKCTTTDCTNSTDWATTTVDSAGNIFSFASITIGTDGFPVISYFDDTDNNLNFAKCTTTDCTNSTDWATTTVDEVSVGAPTSIAIGTDGLPVISYKDGVLNNLNFAKCTTTDCTNSTDWSTTTLDTVGNVGKYPSIAIGTDGNPVISYHDWTNKSLKIAKCKDSSCSGATSSQVLITIELGAVFGFGEYTSIAIGWDGWPVISYYDVDNTALKVAKMRPLVEIQPAWGLSGDSGDALNATQAGACVAGTSWTNGKWFEATTIGTVGIGANECTELAFVLDTVEATASTTYRLRLVKEDGTLLDAYSEYPALTLFPEATSTQRYSKEAILTSGSGCSNTTDYECTTVDSTLADISGYTSIAIGTDGNPVIAYVDYLGVKDLKILKCGNTYCTSGNTITTVVSNHMVGSIVSLAIGTDGYPIMSYYDETNDRLKVLKCGNLSCTSGNTASIIDPVGAGVIFPSLAIGTDGNPVISYKDIDDGNSLNVAKCGNPSCTIVDSIYTLDTGDVWGTSIAIGTDGNPVIAYYDSVLDDLKVARCGDPACMSSSTVTVDSGIMDYGQWPSIAIGTDGNPVISYNRYESLGPSYALKVAKCGDPACMSGNTKTEVDAGDDVGFETSIAIGTDGYPIISYRDSTNDALKIVNCNDSACAGGNEVITTIDDPGTAGTSGGYTSIAIGTDGNPVISYFDDDSNGLKVAKQLGLPKTAISYFNRYIKTDAQVKLTRNQWTTATTGAMWLEASPAIEDGLLYKFDKADYTSSQTSGDSSFSNVTSTGGTSTSTPMFVFADKHSSSTRPIYTQWIGQTTLGADSKNIVLQVFRFGNSSNTTGWVTTTEESSCTANTDCTIEGSTTTDLTDFYFPEYRFNESTGTTTAYYWTFWRIYQKQATGAETTPTLKTDLWQIGDEPFAVGFIKQYHIRWRNDDGGE